MFKEEFTFRTSQRTVTVPAGYDGPVDDDVLEAAKAAGVIDEGTSIGSKTGNSSRAKIGLRFNGGSASGADVSADGAS